MRRFALLALPAALVFVAACGGGGDGGGSGDGNGDQASVTPGDPNDPVGAFAGATATPTQPALPTPVPASPDEQIVQVEAGTTLYAPTLTEFKALPTVTIEAGGSRTGVTLAYLGSQVGAREGVLVTVQGTASDGRIGFIRKPLSEVGASSVLVLDNAGRPALYSSSIQQAEWLTNVTSVSFP